MPHFITGGEAPRKITSTYLRKVQSLMIPIPFFYMSFLLSLPKQKKAMYEMNPVRFIAVLREEGCIFLTLLFFFSVQLLHKFSIHAADGPQKLLKVTGPL